MKQFLIFLDHNTLEIIASLIFFIIGLGVIGAASFLRAKIMQLTWGPALNRVLSILVIIGQWLTILLALRVGLPIYAERGHKGFSARMRAWEGFNLWSRQPLDFSARVLSHTRWVKEGIDIYFISENNLISIRSDGFNKRVVMQAPHPIKEYHFSPDGKFILVSTDKELLLYDIRSKKIEQIDALSPTSSGATPDEQAKDMTGIINGIQWAPDSTKFCYRLARWTSFSSQDSWKIYDLSRRAARTIPLQGIGNTINELVWDKQSNDIYYAFFVPSRETFFIDPFQIKLFRITALSLKSEFLFQIPAQQRAFPGEELAERGVHLFLPGPRLSFGRVSEASSSWESLQGHRVGIDRYDHLYYMRKNWLWRKRLYRIPRILGQDPFADVERRKGDYVIQHLRWLPSGRYVIMEHYFFGILIMEPSSGRIGILDNERGNTFGWYSSPG